MTDRRYTLESSEAERQRLMRQGTTLVAVTDRLFRSAGIGGGMSVLDVGCGAGDVTALVADLVGETGRVVAFDRDPDQVSATAERYADTPQVQVVRGTIDEPPEGRFDAVVGRLVLMYQPDLAEALASLARRVRPGGVMAFLEQNIRDDGAPVVYWPQTPLMRQVSAWIRQGFAATETQVLTGVRLPTAFREAGLEPQLPYEIGGFVYEGRQRAEMTAGLLRSMLPVLADAGVDVGSIGIDTLADRLYADGGDSQISVIGPMLGVWARKATA